MDATGPRALSKLTLIFQHLLDNKSPTGDQPSDYTVVDPKRSTPQTLPQFIGGNPLMEFVTAILAGLSLLKMRAKKYSEYELHRDKISFDFDSKYQWKCYSAVAEMLIQGPAALFVNKHSSVNNWLWQSFMALNYGYDVLQGHFSSPRGKDPTCYGPLGNLRAHIILALNKMGWAEENKDLDCVKVLKVYYEDLNEETLCRIFMEDVQLWCDDGLKAASTVQ